ncbi:hybrid sensor histidine kinase/response regulator [Cupriavidus taiwanensis]|uniref:hybrid sensor histidine kinase/response regulator n=1 Tax=Cupriavidus taiwanensis TaxID=164546 RepID=UPI0025417F15|nr:hybrid sensor histidine kinase/response regulator [Cupriavidus taiwanensis]MDK3022180.1 hybrid sensor histidine kinase/response regulator [Cupriavidus taiwanensis]
MNAPARQPADVAAAMVDLLYRQSNAVLFANFVIALPVCYVLRPSVPAPLLAAWVAAVYLLTTLRIGLSWRYFRRGGSAAPQAWARRFMVLSWVSSLLWGAVGSSMLLPPEPQLVAFCCIVLAGMSSGAIPSLSAHPPTYRGSVAAMLLPFTLYCLMQQGPMYGVYAGFAACLLGANLYYSQVTYRTLRDGVRLRFENLALIGALERERDRATAADQAKTRFLAAAGHDLRQPVYAIGLQAAALTALGERGDVPAAQAHAVGRRLRATLARMDHLLDGLLDASRLDAGLMPVRRRPLPLARLLAEVGEEYAGQARQRGSVLRVVPARAWVDSDPDLLKRILDNLVVNALRHAPRASILVGARRRAGAMEIQVIDTGPGIAPAHQARVFDDYVQVPGTTPADEQADEQPGTRGLGLGLAIVRRLAALLDHAVTLRSAPGRGCVFSVRVPLADAGAAPVLAAAPAEPDGEPLCVMLVDDDPQVLGALTELLTVWGHVVYGGPSVAAVCEAHLAASRDGAAPVHLILADYRLGGGLTGLDAVTMLRARVGHAVPALIVTGDTAPDRLQALHDSGFPVLHKPIHGDALRAALQRAVQPAELA